MARRERRSRSREEYAASLRYQIRDAEEALRNAVEMRAWRNVSKYAAQIQAAEERLARLLSAPTRSERRTEEIRRAYQERYNVETPAQRRARLERVGWSFGR